MFTNNESKMIFFHNPKCGGSYIKHLIGKYYEFQDTAVKLHHQYSDFIEKKNINYHEDTDSHTIRKYGKIRYFMTHQDVNINDFNNFFKFTFVRNPYTRILSAYYYLKIRLKYDGNKIRNTYENCEYFTSFYEFIKNKDNVNNISNYHAFIPQYEHFLDFSNNMNIQYIGKMEKLDEEFINILRINNINIAHYNDILIDKNSNITNSEEKYNFFNEYNEEIFTFVNTYFEKDFEIFNYKRYNTFEEFKLNFQAENYNTIKEKNKLIPIIKLINTINTKQKNDIQNRLINTKLIAHIKDITIWKMKQIDSIENGLTLLNNETENFEKEIKNQTNNLISNYFKDEINICNLCNFKSYNTLSYECHKYFCKV